MAQAPSLPPTKPYVLNTPSRSGVLIVGVNAAIGQPHLMTRAADLPACDSPIVKYCP